MQGMRMQQRLNQLQAASQYCTDKGAANCDDLAVREERVWVGRVGTKQRWLDGGDVGRRLRGKERVAPAKPPKLHQSPA